LTVLELAVSIGIPSREQSKLRGLPSAIGVTIKDWAGQILLQPGGANEVKHLVVEGIAGQGVIGSLVTVIVE